MTSIIGAVGAVASAVSTLFGGGGDVTIGSVTLSGSLTPYPETPERIAWAGRQRLARHVLAGGDIVSHAMGIDYPPIEWRGVLLQSNAIARARQLYAMMEQGDSVELSWFDHDYSVIIETFEPVDLRDNWVEYRICCQVLEDLAGAGTDPQPGLLDQVTGDIGNALGVTLPTMSQMQGYIQQAQAVIAPINSLTGGALTGVQGALATASGGISTLNNVANGALAAYNGLANAAGQLFAPISGGAAATASAISGVVSSAGSAAAGQAAAGYVGRAMTNVGQSVAPPVPAASIGVIGFPVSAQ